MIAVLKTRIATLSGAKKLPAGMDKAILARANEGVAAVESGWQRVTDQVKGGDYTAALALKARAEDVLKSLGGP
jgi:hypothetical protein